MAIRAIILLCFFVVSLPVCFIRPFYGVALWSIVAFLNPQSYVWGAAAFPWALAVAIPTLAGAAFFGRGWKNLASREVFLIVALWVWFTITSLVSSHTSLFLHHTVDTWYSWQLVSKILLMTLVTIVLVDSFDRLRILVIVIAGCFGAYALKSFVFVALTGGADRVYGPENSMIADNNDFGLAMNMTLPLFFFLAQTERSPWMKRLWGLLFLATIPVIFATYSRGALIGLVVVLGLMFLQLKRRVILVPVIAVGIAVAVLFAPPAWQERMNPTRSDAVDASAKSRFNAWTFSWRLASDYPVTGGGFATFTQPLFDRYAPNPRDVHGPHSVYFGVLAEHGFVGLILYLALVVSVLITSRSVVRLARSQGEERVGQYGRMFQFSLVGFLISGMFLGRAYFDYFFMIVACTVILRRVCEGEWSEQDSAELVAQPEEQIA